jgi:hypothetical protein
MAVNGDARVGGLVTIVVQNEANVKLGHLTFAEILWRLLLFLAEVAGENPTI